MASDVQLEREAVATGFECVAVRFLAFEESPIILANEMSRARREGWQAGGRVRDTTPQ